MSSVPERQLTTVERAYQLARSGKCDTIDDIRRTLAAERYDSIQAHLAGLSIRRQLLALCKAAKVSAAEPSGGQD